VVGLNNKNNAKKPLDKNFQKVAKKWQIFFYFPQPLKPFITVSRHKID